MKKAEKRIKMIQIFEKQGMIDSIIRDSVDECLALDDPSTDLIKRLKAEMKRWYGFELTDDQIKEYYDYYRDYHSLEEMGFDTVEREDFGYYLAHKITGLNWPMNGDDDNIKKEFYKSLAENAPKMGYKWNQ